MTDRSQARAILRRAMGDETADFRDGQWEAIDALVNLRQKRLVVERTGWGKSTVYFVSTRILRDRGFGPTVIVSPLLALMRNQIEGAQRLGIRALTINSANRADWTQHVQAILADQADAVLISPERLANDGFVEDVLLPIANRVGLLVVDEAHCISDWGNAFRPDYQRLVNVLRHMPANMPVLATTATANDRVVQDIKAQIPDIGIQRGPLLRESLALQTLRLPDQAARLAWLAEHLPSLPGTGIVYTLTTRDAEQVADWLRQNGIDAAAYYGKVDSPDFVDSNAYRLHLEERLLANDLKVLVATSALGMGYDKPDLGFVVHYQAPGSIVAYYQQVSRAGRAISHAVGLLMAGREDGDIQAFFRNSAFPEEAHVQAILAALADGDGLTVPQIERTVNLRRGQIEHVLKFLSVSNPAPVLKIGSTWVRTPVDYRLDHERIRRLTGQSELEWNELQAYVDAPSCLMQFLTHALDDDLDQPCGKCAYCQDQLIVPATFDHALAVKASRFLRQAEIPLICNKQVAPDAFAQYDLKGNLPQHWRAETGRILSRWGDAGWGSLVAADKRTGRFRDEIVEAVAEMITERWQPTPAPAWITCVPSQRHPELVPDFASRLAARLSLPFIAVVQKSVDNEPQKLQQNRFHRCQNLDGAFAIDDGIPGGPVLLIDDIVDSAWTMTVVAALLRDAGSGPVLPVALSTTSTGD